MVQIMNTVSKHRQADNCKRAIFSAIIPRKQYNKNHSEQQSKK